MAAKVIFAVYGGIRNGNPLDHEAAIVTEALKKALHESQNGAVTINNQTMGEDPAVGMVKQFGAIVEVDGTKRAFACMENQEIDFT